MEKSTYHRQVKQERDELERKCQALKEQMLSQLVGRRLVNNMSYNVIVESPQHSPPTPYVQSPIVVDNNKSTDNNDEFYSDSHIVFISIKCTYHIGTLHARRTQRKHVLTE